MRSTRGDGCGRITRLYGPAGFAYPGAVGWERSRPTDGKEVTRLKKILTWLNRFWFTLKIEFEAGFNKNQDR